MLILLLKTRFRYYLNYLKHNFDRITVIEIGAISLIFLFLLLRSPADIGYRLDWFASPQFSYQWAKIFSIFLPIFYLISELLAWYTLRPDSEWHILGALPFRQKAIASYYLIRQLSKTTFFLLIASILFFAGISSIAIKLVRLFVFWGMFFTLQFASFKQAQKIRNSHLPRSKKVISWFKLEVFILLLLLILVDNIQFAFSSSFNLTLICLLSSWFIAVILYFIIQKQFVPNFIDHPPVRKSMRFQKSGVTQLILKVKGAKGAFLFRDIVFLWRQKRSSYFLFLVGVIILSLTSFAMQQATATYFTLVCLEFLFGLFMSKTVILLFQQDVDGYELIRILPMTAGSIWRARWLFIFGFLEVLMIVPMIICSFKFTIDVNYLIFLITGIIVMPILLATLYCNAGFGLFPHIKLCGFILVVSIMMIILFWFFMPFGSLILLGVMVFWIHRSQKHFQYLELS